MSRKIVHALDGILKISGDPGAYYKGAKRGGDWELEEMFRTINKRARELTDELEKAGLITVERKKD